MKRFVRWLAKIFKAEITIEKEIVVHKDRIMYIVPGNKIEGNVLINGNVEVAGVLTVTGDVICRKIKVEH